MGKGMEPWKADLENGQWPSVARMKGKGESKRLTGPYDPY